MDAASMDHAAMADATMMDPTMEDLFGEAADSLNVPSLPPAPLPASLILRLAEMQSRGCCTKLAWSNTGSIANISPAGSSITFRYMLRDKKTAIWTLSDESKHPIEAPHGRKFVHIQFSGVGVDLAAVDNLGTAHMYTLTSPLGRMTTAPGHIVRDDAPKNELDSVVGMHWLALYPAEFRAPYMTPSIRNGDSWESHLRHRDQQNLRIHHPADGRNAVLHITRSAELTLLYQNEGQGWQSVSVPLEPVRSSNDLLSHAHLGEDGADLLAITYDCSSRFRLYRILITWNATQHSRTSNQTATLINPTLEVHHLTAAESIRAQHADNAKLTHLRLVPAACEAAQSPATQPTVVAVFTHASLPTDATQAQGSFSVIARWKVEQLVPTLHESFTKMKPGAASSAVLNAVTVLRRQPDIITNKIVLSFESQFFDTMFALGASDGTLDFRDRITLDGLQSFGDANTVSSLPQSGFEHMPGDHNVHVAMSADGSGMALVRADGKLVAHPMSLSHGWQVMNDGISDNRPFIEAAAVCVARQYAFLSYNNFSNDEALALVPHETSPEILSLVVKTIFKIMNRFPVADLAMQEANRQQMLVLREPLVPRSLSAQLALGTNPITGERSGLARFAFVLLNLRLIGTALAQTLIRPGVDKLPAEIFVSFCGLLKWSMDLIIYITDSLVDVKRNLAAGASPKDALETLFRDTGNPTLQILMSVFTRGLLRFIVLWLSKFSVLLQQAVLTRKELSLDDRQTLTSVVDFLSKTPFKPTDFAEMLVEFDQALRDAYTKGAIPTGRHTDIEKTIMNEGTFPSELDPAITTLLDTVLPKLMDKADLGKLYFWDTDWLGLANSKPLKGKPRYDVVRKVLLPQETSLRICRRCGSVMEDFTPEKVREMPAWLVSAQRHCVCNNFWILLD